MTRPRFGIDLGTTQIKVMSMTPGGRTESIETLSMPINRRNKKVTHSPKKILDKVQSIPDRLRFDNEWELALACQRSTFILWNKESGDPLTPLISWRDRRAERWIDQLSNNEFQDIQSITGLRPEAGYPLPKICWIRNNNKSIQLSFEKDQVLYGSLDSWLIWKATDKRIHTIDPTQASRTLFYDLEDNEWSNILLDRYNIPKSCLPVIQDSLEHPLDADAIWENAYIINTIGDQPASTIGGQRPPYDQTRVTLGTAGFVAKSCEKTNCPEGLTLSFTPDLEGRVFQAEGVVLSAGRAIDWLARILGINLDTYKNFVSPPWPKDIPLWCPALNGVGAPFWSNRSGALNFIEENTSTRQICSGLVVSILLRIHDILETIPSKNQQRILLDGGLSRLNGLPSLGASIWNSPTAKTLTPHLTCRGALVASHWEVPYFDADPWKNLNIEVVIPNREIPRGQWIHNWKQSLEEWGLETVS